MNTASVYGLRRETAEEAPRTRPPAPRRSAWRRYLPLLIALGFVGALIIAAGDALLPRQDVRVVPVVVKGGTAAFGGAVVARAAGWVEPDPFPTYVSALTNGVVDEVLVLAGEPVAKDQVVARLVPDDHTLVLQRARADLAGARAAAAEAQARLRAAETDWENPIQRERDVAVAVADLDAAAAAQKQLERDIEAAAARLEEAEDRLRREEEELAADAVSEFEVTRTRLRAGALRADLRARESRRPLVAAHAARATAELHAARERLRLRVDDRRALEETRAAHDDAVAAVARAQAEASIAALAVARLEVRSPTDGVVMTRLVSRGSKVLFAMDSPHSAHIVHLYDPKALQVRVDVPLADAAAVGIGQSARIVVDVLPDRTFDGEVTRVVNEADMQKNTLEVKVQIEEPVPDLKPEMLARVEFLAAASGEGGTVSTRFVFAPERLLTPLGGNRSSAWIVAAERAERREVESTGASESGWVQIRSGLQAGDRLIDAPPGTLAEGERVRVVGESGP